MSEYSSGAAQLRRTSQVNVQCLIVDNQEPFLFLARRNVAWTSVESILCYRNDLVCTPILRSWWHLGQAAICVAGELNWPQLQPLQGCCICSATTPPV